MGRELNPEITHFDASCFDGRYCTGDIDETYLGKLEEQVCDLCVVCATHSCHTVV